MLVSAQRGAAIFSTGAVRGLNSSMTLLRDDGTRLLALGHTSPEELLRVTRD